MSPETLSTFEVHPEDIGARFLETKTVDTWSRYQRMMTYLNDGLSCREAATQDGVTALAGEKDYKRFERTYAAWRDGTLPPAVRAVAELHRLGIFPGKDGYVHEKGDRFLLDNVDSFTAANPNFKPVALFSAMQFLSGQLHKSHTRTSAQTRMHNTPPEMRRFLTALTDEEHEDPTVIVGASHSRLLAVLGNVMGNKNEAQLLLPRIPMAALNTLRDKSSSEPEKALARRVLKDFVLAYFGVGKVGKATKYRGQSYTVLVPSPKLAERRADLLVEIFEQAEFDFPVLRKGPYKVGPRRHRAMLSFNFGKEPTREIQTMKKRFQARLSQLVTDLEERKA